MSNNSVSKSKEFTPSTPRTLIFLSHAAPEDNDFTAWLGARLASAGYQVWSDVTKLIGGEVFWKDIEEAIRQHSVKFLSILSSKSPAKRGYMKELSVADASDHENLRPGHVRSHRADALDRYPAVESIGDMRSNSPG